MNPATHTTLDLVRHGEISTRGLLCAGAHEPLSAKGREQMATLEAGIHWDIVGSSAYLRCSEFADALARKLSIEAVIDPAWQEIDFGTWTDRSRDSIWASDKEQLLQLWAKPLGFCAPDGETMIDFICRIQAAFKHLLQSHQGKSILLVTHAGVIRAILAEALGIDYKNTQKFNIEHGKINRLRAYPDGEFSLLNWACSASELK